MSITQKGLGPARQKALRDAGLHSWRDLALYLPTEYRDLTAIRQLASLRAGDTACVRVRVMGPARVQRAGRLHITKCRVQDDSESMQVVWYNQPWLKGQLSDGRELLLFGRCEARFGQLQLASPTVEHQMGLIPVYKQIPGIPQKQLKELIAQSLLTVGGEPEILPESVRVRHGLIPRAQAILDAHMPGGWLALNAARRRLAFEDLLMVQMALMLQRGAGQAGVRIPCDNRTADAFWASMPFPPTGAQRRVLEEIYQDMDSPRPMARLVQGDVGCGKTALAFGALFACAKAGYMGALMAPTEILAQQHYETAQALLGPQGIRCGLLIGSMTIKQKRVAHDAMANGAWDVAIGTHALISEGVEYKRLGLVITDEQHRFGVRQRTILSAKGDSPNVLVMSATPIPRTLALILYGDLDVSVVDELPPGRTPIKTRIVQESKRDGMYGFLLEEIRSGHQVYIVCPLVEASEAVDAKPAEVLYEELRTGPLKDVRVALAHGRMKAADKEAVLSGFHAGQIDVLVATTVIEVGVNVPNASVMVVENAERFGLAQLHQLRGRVGRGAVVSWCFLMADPNERLDLLVQTTDGFVIAQRDMELRGAGEIFGLRQSGVGSWSGDIGLLKETNDEAKALLQNRGDPDAEQLISRAAFYWADRMAEVGMN